MPPEIEADSIAEESTDSTPEPSGPRSFEEILEAARSAAEKDVDEVENYEEGDAPVDGDETTSDSDHEGHFEEEDNSEDYEVDSDSGNEPNEAAGESTTQESETNEVLASEPVPTVPKSDSRDDEIKLLKEELSVLKSYLIAKQGAEQQQVPAGPPKQTEERALHLALYGTKDEEAEWESLPAQVQAQAREQAKEFLRQESLRARDPRAYYESTLRDAILQDVRREFAPLLQKSAQSEGQQAYREIAPDLQSQADIQAVAQAYNDLGVPEGATKQMKLFALRQAAEKVRGTKAKVPDNKEAARKSQAEARETSKAQARPRNPSGRKPAPLPPKKKSDESITEYMDRLKASGHYS